MRYDLCAHLRWLLTLAEFKEAWTAIAAEDQARVAGRPRREVSQDDPALGTGRARAWRGAIRALAAVLPAAAKPLARPMVQIDWLHLPEWIDALVVEGARPITSRAVRRDLQDLCRLQLARGVAMTNTEQQRLGRHLALLSAKRVAIPFDPGGCPVVPIDVRMPLSATSMACGSMVWTDQPAPIVGTVTLDRAGNLCVKPLPLGGRARGPRPPAFHRAAASERAR